MPRATVSAYIITLDEHDTITRAITSVSWMDEIIVIDSGSTDGTVELAADLGATVIHHSFDDFVTQKNVALSHCTSDWAFNLDADEEMTPELRRSVESALAGTHADTDPTAYRIPRRTWSLNRWIRHCGWYPEYRVRLSRAGDASWQGERLHEHLAPTGTVGTLDGDLLHRPYDNLTDHLTRIARYGSMWSEREYAAGRRAGVIDLLLRPLVRFLKMYLVRAGYLDGIAGLIASIMGGYYVFMKYACLRERWEVRT